MRWRTRFSQGAKPPILQYLWIRTAIGRCVTWNYMNICDWTNIRLRQLKKTWSAVGRENPSRLWGLPWSFVLSHESMISQRTERQGLEVAKQTRHYSGLHGDKCKTYLHLCEWHVTVLIHTSWPSWRRAVLAQCTSLSYVHYSYQPTLLANPWLRCLQPTQLYCEAQTRTK